MDRQRILLIFGAAFVSALLLSWLLYAKTTAPKTEKLVRVAAASRDLPAGTRLKKGDLKMVSLPEKDLPAAAIQDEKLILERALLYPVNRNETVTTTKLASLTGAEGVPAMIAPGKRAISVQITDATGVAGLIQPRAHVDVLFTRPGTMTEAITTTILQDIVVLSIGRVTEVGALDTKGPRPQSQAVTLLVTPEEAGKLELAKNQGKISLALRNPLDTSRIEEVAPVTGDALDPLIDARRLKNARTRAGLRGTLRDNRAWAELTGADPDEEARKKAPPPPPKPRAVVDVYRGDKHVQEIFHQ